MTGQFAALLAAAPLLASGGDPGLSSTVLWAAGVAAFIGFIFGSVPPRGANRGWQFDMPGAVVWAVVAAAIVGGIASGLTTGVWAGPGIAIGLGLLFAFARIINTLPPRQPKGGDLLEVVNRAAGDTPKARLKAARRMYNNAGFQSGGRYATRGLREWDFGKAGASVEYMNFLGGAVRNAYHDTFAILVILVNELPGEPDQPAVIVVNGPDKLRQVKVDAEGLLVPGYEKKIPGSAVSAFVGYAWR